MKLTVYKSVAVINLSTLFLCICVLNLPVGIKVHRYLTDDRQDGNNSDCHDDCWSVKDWSARKGTRSSLSMVSLPFVPDSTDMIILYIIFKYF